MFDVREIIVSIVVMVDGTDYWYRDDFWQSFQQVCILVALHAKPAFAAFTSKDAFLHVSMAGQAWPSGSRCSWQKLF